MPLMDLVKFIQDTSEHGKRQKAIDEVLKGYGYPTGMAPEDFATLVSTHMKIADNSRAETEFGNLGGLSPSGSQAATAAKAQPSESAYREAAGKNLGAEAEKTNLGNEDLKRWMTANPTTSVTGSKLDLEKMGTQSHALQSIAALADQMNMIRNTGGDPAKMVAPFLGNFKFPSSINDALGEMNKNPKADALQKEIEDQLKAKQVSKAPAPPVRGDLTSKKTDLESRIADLERNLRSPQKSIKNPFPMMGTPSTIPISKQGQESGQIQDMLKLEEFQKQLRDLTGQIENLPPDEQEAASARLKDYLERQRLQ